jgi:glycogen(starch) synthase
MNWPHPKRILMTADTVGGVWTYAVELCRALADYEVEIALCTMGREPSVDQLLEVRGLENVQLFASEFRLEWMENPWEDVASSSRWLAAIAERFRPDLVHLNTFAHGALAWKAPTLMVGHSCVFSWWKSVHGTRPPAEWQAYQSVVGRGLRAANMVIAPSFAMLEALQRFYGPLRNCEVIPNGIEPLDGGGAKEPFILCAGRLWDEAKNISLLAEIAPEVPWPVVVAGDCGEKAPPKNVRCLGKLTRPRVTEWMQRAAVYAAPAKYEPFGLSILEAASAGCALVLGDIPSLRENWEGAAEFADPFDKAAWTKLLTDLTRDAFRTEVLAESARARASEFSISRMANAYLSVYADTMIGRIPAAIA